MVLIASELKIMIKLLPMILIMLIVASLRRIGEEVGNFVNVFPKTFLRC